MPTMNIDLKLLIDERSFSMRDECHDDNNMITKSFDECEKCTEFPCLELLRALQAVIDGEN